MSFLFGDSFDYYVTADKLLKWTSVLETGGIKTVITPLAARNGLSGLRCSPSGGDFALNGGVCLRKTLFPSDPTTIVFGVAFRYNQAQVSASYPFISWWDGGTIQGCGILNPDGTIHISRGAATNIDTGSSSVALLQGNFYHLKVEIVLGATGSAKIWVNAVLVYSKTGVNTQAIATQSWSQFSLGFPGLGGNSAGSVELDYDDLWVRDDNNDKFDLTALALHAEDGNGSNNDYTPSTGSDHGAMVSEVNEDGDATYNETDVIGDVDTYTLEDMPVNASVAFIQHVDVCRKTDLGDVLCAAATRIGGTNYFGANYAPNQTYAQMLTPSDVSPATAVAYTAVEINAMEAGQKRTG